MAVDLVAAGSTTAQMVEHDHRMLLATITLFTSIKHLLLWLRQLLLLRLLNLLFIVALYCVGG